MSYFFIIRPCFGASPNGLTSWKVFNMVYLYLIYFILRTNPHCLQRWDAIKNDIKLK